MGTDGTGHLGPPPPNLLAQFTPLDKSNRFVRASIEVAKQEGVEITDEQLALFCAWGLSHPDLGLRYLRELKR
jgi:hypothetical protein